VVHPAELGLVRTARLAAIGTDSPRHVQVLDGVLNLLPPGVGVKTSAAR
jgi:hypothetical protein